MGPDPLNINRKDHSIWFQLTGAEGRVTDSGVGIMPHGEDKWIHRSQHMKCRTCMWFAEKKGPDASKPSNVGRCRRHAPTMGGYPVVFNEDWCGDHKLNELVA